MHSHPAGVVDYFVDAAFRTTLQDGRVTEPRITAGETIWREPVAHASENIGTTEAHGLEGGLPLTQGACGSTQAA